MNTKRLLSVLLLIAALISAVGCNAASDTASKNSKKLIAVSIQPQITFVQKLCGDEYEVFAMIPPGASPETYEPTPKEMKKLESASVYFSIGVPAEENYTASATQSGIRRVELHTQVEKLYPELLDEEGRDPHIWLSPKRVKAMVNVIESTLTTLNSANADKYKANAAAYVNELDGLDNEITELFKQKKRNTFIVYHPSYGYFADDYGLEMCALEEHGKETTAKRIAEVADFAEKENIKYIFYQTEASERQPQAFAEEIGGTAVGLEPLAADYTGSLLETAQKIAEALK